MSASIAEYYVEWRSSAGVRRAVLPLAGGPNATTGITRLVYRRELNAPGQFQISTTGTLGALSTFADKDQVLIYRRPVGQAWRVDFDGLFRDERYQDDELGQERVVLSGPGVMALLNWYHVMWYANVSNRTVFSSVAAETILKTLVNFNAVSANATTTNGRLRNAASQGISIATDTAAGNVLTVRGVAWQNLLAILQQTQLVAGLDFDLVRTGAATYEFRTYAQRGTDRRNQYTVSRAYGTMTNVLYEIVRSREATTAVVLGQGEETARAVRLVNGPNYNVTTNNIETVVEATDVPCSIGQNDALDERGDKYLEDVQARPTLQFQVTPTQSVRYGVNLDLGDLLTAVHPRMGTIDVQVTSVTVEVDVGLPAGERITIGIRQL